MVPKGPMTVTLMAKKKEAAFFHGLQHLPVVSPCLSFLWVSHSDRDVDF